MLYVDNKEIVFPGTLLTDNNYKLGSGTFREDGKIFSNMTGLAYFESSTIRVIPFKNAYKPKYGDLVIGRVTNSSYSSWTIDINSTYQGFLPTSELYNNQEQNISHIINVKDILLLRISNVDEINRVKLTLRANGLGKFNQGTIKKVKQTTTHFLSEENAFLLNMMRERLHSDVIVAKNGLIWINGLKEDMDYILEIIDFIEENPFMNNLVKEVQNFILNV